MKFAVMGLGMSFVIGVMASPSAMADDPRAQATIEAVSIADCDIGNARSHGIQLVGIAASVGAATWKIVAEGSFATWTTNTQSYGPTEEQFSTGTGSPAIINNLLCDEFRECDFIFEIFWWTGSAWDFYDDATVSCIPLLFAKQQSQVAAWPDPLCGASTDTGIGFSYEASSISSETWRYWVVGSVTPTGGSSEGLSAFSASSSGFTFVGGPVSVCGTWEACSLDVLVQIFRGGSWIGFSALQPAHVSCL